jgi:hypothetical protein
MPPLRQLVVVSFLVMGVAHTISKERLFAPLRERLGGHQTWLGYLVSCPYCISHWIAFVVVPLTRTYAVDVPYEWGPVRMVLRWFLSSLAVSAIATFFRVAFYFIDEGQLLNRRRKKAFELETNGEAARDDAHIEKPSIQ